MEFGAFVSQGWRMELAAVPVERQWDTLVSGVLVAEEVGFDSVWVYDHFHTVPEPSSESTFEAWTVMAGLAEATDRIRLGQMCTANSYRMPAYLAKVSSCVDVMSGGRLDVGIGAGWYEHEYLGFGYEFPKASVRIGQLAEGVQILKAMWTEDQVDFDGRHYRLTDGRNSPKPLQDPHPPLWIAGGGEQLTLRVVAEHGDYANFLAPTLTEWQRKRDVLLAHCEAVDRDPAEIGVGRNFDCLVAATEEELAEKLERFRPTRGTMDEWREAHIWGTPAQVIEKLQSWQRGGLDYAILFFVDATWGDGMRLFGEEVIPALNAG